MLISFQFNRYLTNHKSIFEIHGQRYSSINNPQCKYIPYRELCNALRNIMYDDGDNSQVCSSTDEHSSLHKILTQTLKMVWKLLLSKNNPIRNCPFNFKRVYTRRHITTMQWLWRNDSLFIVYVQTQQAHLPSLPLLLPLYEQEQVRCILIHFFIIKFLCNACFSFHSFNNVFVKWTVWSYVWFLSQSYHQEI